MIANIIHNPNNEDRAKTLQAEIFRQKTSFEVKIWDAIYLNRAYRGIMQAHKQIVRYAKENNLPEVWIMEDDVRFPNIYGVEYFFQNKPKDFDLYLGGIYSGGIRPDNTVLNFSGLHCYIVNSRFYDKFLQVPENMHLDRGLGGKGKFVVCNPFAAIQHNGFSENTGKIENYDHHLKKYRIYGV
jgi:hypothetical protein